jgi:hypothetical protein
MICLILPLYVVGAVIFWSSHRSESLKRDFLLGLAWPLVVPVMVALFALRLVLSALEERAEERAKERATREAELRGREERFIGYGGAGAAKWMDEEAAEGKDKVEAEKEKRFFS